MHNHTATGVTCDTLPSNTLTVEQAQQRILEAIPTLTVNETVGLMQANARILSQAIQANLDVPPYTNSAMDGYALRYADLATHSSLKVIGTALAGHPFIGTVQAGECVRIMTGAMLPDDTDTVVMQENVTRQAEHIQVTGKLKATNNVRYTGEDIRAGHQLLAAGRRLNAADIGLLASQGIAEVSVLRKPKIAFCSTGDELQSLGHVLQAGQIYDSNRYTLNALLQALDVEIIDLGVVRDTPEAVAQVFQQASNIADVFISSGGVSVGEADYVTDTLKRMGEVNFWKIAFKPGKPLTFGKLNETCWFFGLPGNPVSVMVTFLLFARPAILKLRGETAPLLPEYQAVCSTKLKKAPGRKDYQRGICEQDANGQWTVKSTGNQGSHVLTSMSQANCFIVLPLESGSIEAGSTVTIIPFAGLM
jgi:molybdopterin molybdotransferase